MTPDESFGPARRIKQRQDFLRIQQHGRKVRSAHLLLVSAPPKNPETTDSRLGVTITRKIDKRATRRNTLKRRIKEHFRRFRPELNRPVDLVVIALNEATELNFEQVGGELEQLLRRAKLL